MEIKEYISSGILELYVLGKLDAAEREEVERYAREFPEIRAEIDSIEKALENLALLSDRTPPPGTLDRILERIDVPPAVQPVESARIPGKPATAFPVWTVLLLLAALAATALALVQYQKNQRLTEEIEQERLDRQAADVACDSIAQDRQRLQAQVAFLQDPNTRPIIMEGTALSPQSIAAVFYNPERRQAYLGNLNLPPPPTGKQYQLWALVDGKPVDMGLFDLQVQNFTSPLKDVPFIENAGAFAITLEDDGGKPSPDLTQLFVIGNVG